MEELFKQFGDLPAGGGKSKGSCALYPTPELHAGEPSEVSTDGCAHAAVAWENTVRICKECGIVLNKDLSFEKEWRYYGISDTKHTSDPNRCNARRSDEKSIFRDVDKMGFSDKIVSSANLIYEGATLGRIYRGNTRRGIIFACIFHAYKVNHNPQSCESLIEIFQITNKVALKGLKFVNMHAPKTAIFRGLTIDITHLIREVLLKFHAQETQIQEAVAIYERVKNRSILLNRSRPQSVASGVVRYYITQSPYHSSISPEYFRSRVRLSELTIHRIAREVARLIEEEPASSDDGDRGGE